MAGNHYRVKVGLLDHTSSSLGGAQFVNACIAEYLSCTCDVELIHSGEGYTLPDLARAFSLDLSRTQDRIIKGLTDADGFGIPGPRSWVEQITRCRRLTRRYDIFIYSGLNVPPFCFAKRGFAYIHFPMDTNPVAAHYKAPGCSDLSRHMRKLAYGVVWRAQMRSYDQLLANSAYTAGWIERRWDRPAQVVYPPVETEFPLVPKRNLIVSVGRFTAGKRSKHQLKQVQAFQDFSKMVGETWELCLIGFCSKSPEDRRYLAKIEEAACGMPVTILLDGDRQASRQQIAEARLFWHTTGLDIDESTRPEWAEHFGIATVEAMRAGCVPVVIASGGQREIIEHAKSGFLVRDLAELVQTSIGVATNTALRAAIGEAARQRSLVFTKEAFNRRIATLVSRFLHQAWL